MKTFTYVGMNFKEVAIENFYGISVESISTFVNKYVRIAVRDENKPYCSTAVDTFVGGAEHYRITIVGAYMDVRNGGAVKTDYSFAKISIEQKQANGRYSFIHLSKTESVGGTAESYFNLVMDKILDMLIENISAVAKYNKTAESVIDAYEDNMNSEISEKMSEKVADYQRELDGYVVDILAVAEDFGSLKTKIDAFTAKKVLEKIMALSEDCLTACGDISGCVMVWDDGYHIDLSAIGRWWRGESYMDMDMLKDLIDALGCMLSADCDMPLAEEDIMEELEEDGELVWLRGYMPIYLYDEIRDFASTYYHYAYCA